MAEKRLGNLLILFCESGIKMNTEEIINDFALKNKLFKKSLLY